MLAVFAAVLTGGCGGDPGGSDAGSPSPGASGPGAPDQDKTSPTQAHPPIKPAGSLLPPTHSGDVPDAFGLAPPDAQTAEACDAGLAKGDYKSVVMKMGQVASAPDSTSITNAIAYGCKGAANASLGNYRQALLDVDAAKRYRRAIPPGMRPQLLELLYHTEVVSAAAVGERDRAEEALARLEQLGRQPGDYVRDACAVAPDPAAVPECATATPSVTVTESPSGAPKRSVTPQPEESIPEPTDDTPTDDTPTDGATNPPDDRNSVPPDGDDDEPAPNDS
ncbi:MULTISPECIES: hypothetical protein [unclassified Nonomuraea]|uniref:hypothetical protein n=1 Tax=unclassified Nonomuraea TaxID=2593643 RepID=UPI0033F574CE